MAYDEEHRTERSPGIRIQGPPGRPFKLTIEIPLMLCMLGWSMTGSAISNIIFFRTCVHSLNHTAEECKGFLSPIRSNSTKLLEESVQKYATFVLTVKIVMESICPAVLSMFLGVWSDTYGRKPLIVWPMLGMTLTSMLVVIYGMVDLNPWLYILTIVPFSVTGGYVVLFTGAYCYVSDIATNDSTSFRMTLVDATLSVGNVIGSLLSTYLILHIGNVNLLLLVACINVMAYTFTNIFLEESLTGALQGGFSKILDWLYVKEMAHECFKTRPNHGKAQIILLIVVRTLSVFLVFGTLGIEYQYVREKLHWALQEFNTYTAVSTAVIFVGSFLGVTVIQKLLPVSDLMLTTVAFLSAIAEFIIKAFAVTTWQMYFSVIISIFKGLSGPLIKSYLSKMLPVEDIAKVFAMMCAIEGLSPLIAPVVCSSVYVATLTTFPGTIYLIGCGLTIICVVLLGFVQYYSWNASTTPYCVLEEET
ncbi:unnamed protein product [Parnassius apollo]|uniref:(apollo) hypothetical protein n=1 Tax=Parnassius apollo TaxID=110799 RepID=A0A8S3Y728_PARAO|nr:unnamed protein product [Parnassius apollo]